MTKQHEMDLTGGEVGTKPSGPVTCLGMTFDNDEARRAYFTEELHKKLQDPDFRKIEVFPIGSDEDILNLSDPPYYTACPNPFLDDFVRHYGKPYDPEDPFHCTPFGVDVSEGKTDALYKAHSYHTKVPHLARCDEEETEWRRELHFVRQIVPEIRPLLMMKIERNRE